MIVNLPVQKDPILNRALEAIRSAFGRVVDLDTAAPFVLLRAPGGKTFKVTVSDAGTLTATAL